MLSKYKPWTNQHLVEKVILQNTDSAIKMLTQIRYRSDNYQYIQNSIIPTMHFQRSLPRLPVPELKSTCQRYLKAQQPLLSKNDFLRTKDIVQNFEQNDGLLLQEMLKTKNDLNKDTSYITKDWFNMYLSERTPLPINYNPLLVFKQLDNAYNNQLLRSTNLLISSLRFYKSLNANKLEPEIFHINPKKSDTIQFRKLMKYLPESISWYGAYMYNAYPLDMSQYTSLFNSTRIPMINQDVLHNNTSGKHIVVMRRGHFYKFDVLDNQGNILEPQLLLSKIKYILNDNIAPSNHPIGILTTTERNNWADLRNHLINLGNEESLRIIDDSLIIIALDDENPGSDPISCFKQYLHSDGINRWFDKSFTLIVCADGTSGLNFEHSWGDGVAVLRYFQDISKDTTDFPRCHPENLNQVLISADALDVKKLVSLRAYTYLKEMKLVGGETSTRGFSGLNNLITCAHFSYSGTHCESKIVPWIMYGLAEFNLDEKIKCDIIKVKNEFKCKYESLDINYFEFFNVGRKMCKQFGISADSLMQLCFQLGHYKLHKKHVGTYESCSTAAFKQGRTETVRPCTTKTADFCYAVSSSNKPSNNDLVNMIKQCSVEHSKLVKEAAMGQGFDRHLFALRLLAKENNLKIPDLFTDPAYSQINHNILSTSSLTSDYVWLGGFGPVVKDGYGIGYTILEDYSGAIISNYKEHSDGDKFRCALTESLNQILDILKT